MEAVDLSIKIQSFSWKIKFLVLDHCPVPCILGDNFLTAAKMQLDFADHRYSFLFQPEKKFQFWSLGITKRSLQEFPCSQDVFSHLICGSVKHVADDSARLNDLIRDFPALF
jgi:hypothetical protein